jgi:uncharacterized protein
MEKAITALINKVKKDKKILAVAFFGSYARKEKNKDIDICLFLFPGKYSLKEISKIKLKYSFENEKYDLQIFQGLPIYIKKRILKDAKFIYVREEDLLYDLSFYTLKEYSHFKYIYEDYLQGVMENG